MCKYANEKIMKANKNQLDIIKNVFASYNKLVVLEQNDYLECLLTVLKETDTKHAFKKRGDADYLDFGIKAYIRHLKECLDDWEIMLLNVELTRNIIDGIDDNDNDEICEVI